MRKQLHSSSLMKPEAFSTTFLCFIFGDEEYTVTDKNVQFFLYSTVTRCLYKLMPKILFFYFLLYNYDCL